MTDCLVLNPVQDNFSQNQNIIPNGPLMSLHPDQELIWSSFEALNNQAQNNTAAPLPHNNEDLEDFNLEFERKMCLKAIRKTRATPHKSENKSKFSIKIFIDGKLEKKQRERPRMTWEEAKAKYSIQINHLLFKED